MVGRLFAGTTHKKCHHRLYHHHQDDDMYVENGCWWVGRMWDWAANPPLPKRLTAAPVRIKPVPRSLLSIHSAIVDLQFVFFALAYLCLMFACVSMFSRSNQSYPSLPIYSFSMDKYSVLFLLLSDLEKYICLTFLRFT